ncbi:MAG: chemotaxis protein CheW [Gammaproteobacteria bacterium]|nr:chemotaxis protein CheW [Gammaproteobacteria bacterium]
MSQKSHVAVQTQLADASSALNDYFDVLLQEVTGIVEDATDDKDVVRAVAQEPASVDSTEKATLKFVVKEPEEIEKNETIVTSEVVEEPVAVEVASKTEGKTAEISIEVAPILGVSTQTKKIVSDSTETLEVTESEIIIDEPNADEVEDAVEIDSEDYFVEGAPDWACRPFQALEFTVAKLKLVIPLVHLCGILDWEYADLTQMPGHSEHFIGVWPNHGINSKIVDIANMIVPQRYQSKISPWQERISKVVLIDESIWGLACDDILGVVTLDPRDVRWRTDRARRPWLAGTLIEQMSAIIDGEQFAVTLLQGEKNEDCEASCTPEGT